MKLEELKKAYEEKAKILGLPDFQEINKGFHIESESARIDELPTNLLAFINYSMANYSNSWINFCYNNIFGNPQSLIIMEEARFFDDARKKELAEIMTRIVVLSRHDAMLSLKNDEQSYADQIKRCNDEWKQIRPKLLELSGLVVDKWSEYKDKQLWKSIFNE